MSTPERQVFFDTETTGIEASEHRVIEIGAIEMKGRRITGERRWYLNPDRDSDPGALEVHGLTTAFLADKPRFPQVADDVIDYLRGAELIIHNAAFDVGFMDRELERAGRPERIGQMCTVTDTVRMAKRLHPGQKASLDALCKRYGVDNSHRELHGALLDARLLAEVYLAMTGGQSTLGLVSDTAGGNSPSADGRPKFGSEIAKPLRVLRASESELTAHLERITALAKKSGRHVWPEAPPAPAPPPGP